MTVKYSGEGIRDNTDETKVMSFDVSGVTTNTTRTLTMPDRNVTIGDAGDLTGSLPAIDGSSLTGVGKVLQVVSMTNTVDTTYTNTSYTYTMWDLDITPASTSSKILVFWDDSVTVQGDSNFTLRLSRDTTDLMFPYKSAGNFGSSNQHGGGYGFHYLDSPNSTATLSYTIAIKKSGSGSIRLNGEGGHGSFTLMEISG